MKTRMKASHVIGVHLENPWRTNQTSLLIKQMLSVQFVLHILGTDYKKLQLMRHRLPKIDYLCNAETNVPRQRHSRPKKAIASSLVGWGRFSVTLGGMGFG